VVAGRYRDLYAMSVAGFRLCTGVVTMWLLALALVADTIHSFSLALTPAESVAVTMTEG